jgi:tetratricopeptide (TPR) repeat protein
MESKEVMNGGEITKEHDIQSKSLRNDSSKSTRIDIEPTKLEIPRIEKKLGDVKLSEKDYEAAIHHYKNSIMALKILFDDEQYNNGLDDLKAAELIEEIGIPVHLNLAYCYLQLEEKWESVIYYCNKVLELKPDQLKALYRRCKAYLKLKNVKTYNFNIVKIVFYSWKKLKKT